MDTAIFEQNPSLDLYYQTADGTAFYTKNTAELHAKTLEDKTVVLRTRNEKNDATETLEDVQTVEQVDTVEDVEIVEEVDTVEDVETVVQVDTVAEVETIETPKAKRTPKKP